VKATTEFNLYSDNHNKKRGTQYLIFLHNLISLDGLSIFFPTARQTKWKDMGINYW